MDTRTAEAEAEVEDEESLKVERSEEFKAMIKDLFSDIYITLDSTVSISGLVDKLNSLKDSMPQGSIRREYDAIVKEFSEK